MKNFKFFYNKNKKKIILTALFIFFLPLLCIHLLFKWKSGIPFIEAEWNAGEVLDYVGTFLSFIGTIILGFLALEASNTANELSKKVIQIEESRYKLDNRPFVIISGWNSNEINSYEIYNSPAKKYIQIGEYHCGNALAIELELTNTSESYITVGYNSAVSNAINTNWKNVIVNQENPKMLLKPGESDTFVFYAEESFMIKLLGQKITLALTLENRFSKRYKETVELVITALSKQIYKDSKKWYCHIYAQDYTISRYEKDESGKTICIKEDL